MKCCSPWGLKELDTTEQLNWTQNQLRALIPNWALKNMAVRAPTLHSVENPTYSQLSVYMVPPHLWIQPTSDHVVLLLLFSHSVVSNSLQPMDRSTPGFSVLQYLPEFAKTHVHWVSDAIQPSHPLSRLLMPSIFPSIRVFSNALALRIRWPKYWSFSISPSDEYSGLISFRIY